ncbi:MAG: bifunctional folylpolyglutamate synthase/dihydrofolate synthase [Deltaproteobacteria bacterium]
MNDAICYLNSLGRFKVKPGLERVSAVLKSLGNPHNQIPCLIIGGTNGKGSTAAAIASGLEAAGFAVGLYTSPHLVQITERVKVNSAQIAPAELSALVLRIRDAAEAAGVAPSYFEVLTAAAFLYFAERGVDFSVLEVGMGGLWDATNVASPLVSVITNVSRDHTEFLGESAVEIAAEKAGIIKPGTPAVTAATGDALGVIRAKARDVQSPLRVMGADFRAEGMGADNFRYRGEIWNLENASFSLAGAHQIENASLAIAALETLKSRYGIAVSERDLRAGLSRTRWAGRMEILRSEPPLVLDGAHNEAGAAALRKSLELMYPNARFTFLIAMLSDKRHEEYLMEISPIAEEIIITEAPSERSADGEWLAAVARRICRNTRVIKNWREAVKYVIGGKSPVCVSGSLYLIGAVKGFIQER